MPYYEFHDFTTTDQVISDLATFVAANGWIVDFSGTYNSHNRLHFHDASGSHFEIWYASSTIIYLLACTGYSSGSAPTAQPNANQQRSISSWAVGQQYGFVSAYGGVYLLQTITGNWRISAGMCTIADADKIGSWTGGCLCFAYTANPYISLGDTAYASSGYAQLWRDGAWTPTTVAGGLCGSVGSDVDMLSKQPSQYNGEMIPLNINLYIYNSSVTTLRHPIAKAVPGLQRCNGGDIYSVAEEIPVGADTCLIMPTYNTVIGGQYYDVLFTLGSY